MTDKDVFIKHYHAWKVDKPWTEYIECIPTNELIQLVRYGGFDRYANLRMLKCRDDIPEEMKLEVLLTGEDDYDGC